MPRPCSGARGTVADFDARPEEALVDLRIASVHATGRILRWHVVARKDMTVAELLQALVMRSQVTETPFRVGCLILVELIHSRLFRIFDPIDKLGKLGANDTILVYEVLQIDADTSAESSSTTITTDMSKFQIVACHSRVERDAITEFFEDNLDESYRELVGIPLIFRVSKNVTHCRLYEIVSGLLQHAQASHSNSTYRGDRGVISNEDKHVGIVQASSKDSSSHCSAPFTLYTCEQIRMLNTGGKPLNPCSVQEVGMNPPKERSAIMLVAEWANDVEPPSWVFQRVCTQTTEPSGCFLEVILGFDVTDFLERMHMLRESEHDLRNEVLDLKQRLGNCATLKYPQVKLDSKGTTPRNQELLAKSTPRCSSGKRNETNSDDKWGFGNNMRLGSLLYRDLNRPLQRYGDGSTIDVAANKHAIDEKGQYHRHQPRECLGDMDMKRTSITDALANLTWN